MLDYSTSQLRSTEPLLENRNSTSFRGSPALLNQPNSLWSNPSRHFHQCCIRSRGYIPIARSHTFFLCSHPFKTLAIAYIVKTVSLEPGIMFQLLPPYSTTRRRYIFVNCSDFVTDCFVLWCPTQQPRVHVLGAKLYRSSGPKETSE